MYSSPRPVRPSAPQAFPTSSLSGLERVVPPPSRHSPAKSGTSSPGDLQKPLPPVPLHLSRRRSSSSSAYSQEAEEIIDFYLYQENGPPQKLIAASPYSLFSEASRSLRSLHNHSAVLQPIDQQIYQNSGKCTTSDSMLRLPPSPISPSTQTWSRNAEPFTHEVSPLTPSPPPSVPRQVPRESTQSVWEDCPVDDLAMSYRDTLLPESFGPPTTSSHVLNTNAAPLRGPRSPNLQLPGSDLPTQLSLSSRTGSFDSIHSVSSTFSAPSVNQLRSLALREKQRSPLPSPHLSPDLPNSSRTAHMQPPFTTSLRRPSVSPLSRSISPMRLRISSPPPEQEPAPKGGTDHQSPVDGSLLHPTPSNVSTSVESSFSRARTPPNFSPSLKPSKPNIPRVPRACRSPAIPLTPYQIKGPKAWEEEERARGDVKGFKARLRGRSLNAREDNDDKSLKAPKTPKAPKSFGLGKRDSAKSLLKKAQDSGSASASPIVCPTPTLPPHTVDVLNPFKEDPDTRITPFPRLPRAHTFEIPPATDKPKDESRSRSRTRTSTSTTPHAFDVAQARISNSNPQTTRSTPNSVRNSVASGSSGSNKLSWLPGRKWAKGATKEDKKASWREEMKKKIVVVGAKDSMGIGAGMGMGMGMDMRESPAAEGASPAQALQEHWDTYLQQDAELNRGRYPEESFPGQYITGVRVDEGGEEGGVWL